MRSLPKRSESTELEGKMQELIIKLLKVYNHNNNKDSIRNQA